MSAVRKDQTMVRKDVTVVREEVKALTVMMQLPRSMGYDLNNAVLLIDAYGEERVLPMPNCASPEVCVCSTSHCLLSVYLSRTATPWNPDVPVQIHIGSKLCRTTGLRYLNQRQQIGIYSVSLPFTVTNTCWMEFTREGGRSDCDEYGDEEGGVEINRR